MPQYIITKGDKTFNATKEQSDFFDFIEHESGNAVIKAAAGSAKTSTIENCLKYISEDKKVLFIAFNVSVRDEIRKDVSRNQTTTKITTFHGLGYSILSGIIGNNTEVYEFKYKKYINDHIDQLTSFKETKSLGVLRNTYIRNINKLTDYARYYCVMKPSDILKLTKIYTDIVPVRDEAEVVSNILKWGQSEIKQIDYTDMIWLPFVLNIESKSAKFDYIFIDEAQDVTIAEEKLIEKVRGRGCRLVAVGDENQRINVWCGASKKAMDNFKNAPNTKIFKLSTSFRIPQVGEKFIHKCFPEIEIQASPQASEGRIRYDVSLSLVNEKTMVLCRNLAPLLEAMLTVMRMNKPCYLKGWENEKELFQNIIKKHPSRFIDKNMILTDGLFTQLWREMLLHIDLLIEEHGLSYEEALRNDFILDLYDKIKSIDVLSEGLSTTDELLDKLSFIFNENNDTSNAIIFSTVHKAKGLEAENVFILKPSLMPNPHATEKWEIEAERNLQYVAFTRFKQTLNFIKEDNKDFHVGNQGIKKEIEDIKQKIGYLKEEFNPLKNALTSVAIEKSNIEERKVKHKVKGGLKFGKILN